MLRTRLDYVAVHQHAPEDVALGALFPPAVVAEGVTPDPVLSSGTYVDLDDMQITVTPPAGISPLWECELWFDGSFSAIDAVLRLRLVQDPAGTPVQVDTPRRQAIVLGPSEAVMALAAVVVVPEGEDTSFGVQWLRAGTDVTALDVERRLTGVLRPYQTT